MPPYPFTDLVILSYDSDDELPPFLDLTASQLSSSCSRCSTLLESDGSDSSCCIRPRSICFSDTLEEVFEIAQSRCQVSREDLWYERDEMKSFKTEKQRRRRNLQTVGRILQDDHDDDDCIEGLEPRQSSKPVIDAVLTEQATQYCKGKMDPESISNVSRRLSSLNIQEAINRGLRLQNDVSSSSVG